MKERPILFSAPMVRAILEGRKTQTRRVVKHAPAPWNAEHTAWDMTCCPYGQPGDRLWVRETWGAHFMWDDVPPSGIPNDGKACLFYMADGFSTGGCSQTRRDKWRPSIHMPRWASRITLEIAGVRVERLQDISEKDAQAEGAMYHDGRGIGHSGWRHDYKDVHVDARSSFYRLWQEINGPGSWDANPWVWVVEFKRI